MQTFLPYPSFLDTAKALDYRRLGKQRVEAKQILNTLKSGGGWSHHPAVKMWRGYEEALRLYYNYIVSEWIERGCVNNMPLFKCFSKPDMPPWVGDKAFHDSHKSNLLRKNPDYYGGFGWNVRNDLPYIWPV